MFSGWFLPNLALELNQNWNKLLDFLLIKYKLVGQTCNSSVTNGFNISFYLSKSIFYLQINSSSQIYYCVPSLLTLFPCYSSALWSAALGFLVYAWRTVLWELGNWKKATLAVISFFSYLSKFVLAFIFRFIGDPLTGLIRCVEFTLYSLRYIYSSIVAFAPVPELTRIILFSSAVLAIAEATVPESVERQQFILSLSGLIAFGAVSGYILEIFFWFFLCSFFLYSYFFRKRDAVSAALPSAAVLVAVGEPWVRILVFCLYLSLAIFQYSKSSEIQRTEVSGSVRKPPVPLQVAALSIGIHVAAKWIRHRHLTWMIA